MVDNVQKLPLGRTLQEHARRKVLEHIQLLSGRAPATLVQAVDKTNTIWMVKFDTDGTYTLPQVTIAVHGSEYSRVPYQQGAKGHVSVADMAISAMTGLASTTGPAAFVRGANLSDLIWHPVGNVNFQAALDPNAHETYGASGGTITHDGTAKSLVKTHATNGTSVSSGGDGSGAPGPHVMTTSTNGTSIATTAAHTLQAQNATLDAQGNQANQGNSTSQGNISTPKGNISAPAGAVTGQSGGFGGGFIGLLSIIGGALSGPPSTNGSLTVSTPLVAAAALQTNAAYTVAELNAAMPPDATTAGTRAYVTDAQANPTFLQMLTGGGQQGCPAVCVYGSSTNSSGENVTGYMWVAG